MFKLQEYRGKIFVFQKKKKNLKTIAQTINHTLNIVLNKVSGQNILSTFSLYICRGESSILVCELVISIWVGTNTTARWTVAIGPRRSGQSVYRRQRGISHPGMAQVVWDPSSNHNSSNSINHTRPRLLNTKAVNPPQEINERTLVYPYYQRLVQELMQKIGTQYKRQAICSALNWQFSENAHHSVNFHDNANIFF